MLYNLDMRLAVFLLLFLLTPLFSLSADDTSDNVCIFAVPRAFVTIPDISVESIKDDAIELVKALPEKIDTIAITLVDKLENTKKNAKDNPLQDLVDAENETQVLGAFDENADDNHNNLTASAYNAGVDVLAFLLRHWMWTLSSLAVLGLLWSFRS